MDKDIHTGQLPAFPALRFSGKLAIIWREAILPYLGTRLALIFVGLLADFYILPLLKNNLALNLSTENTHFPDTLWLMWQHFDSGFYLDIARLGYDPAGALHAYSNWAFYPLLPLLVYPFAHLFGGSSIAFTFAGLLVANGAALVAITYFYALIRREFGPLIASRAVIYLALFPTAFYLSAIYTEPVFLACAVMCIYYARTHHWWLASLCGGLAALAKAQGILLLVPLAWELWQTLSDQYMPLPAGYPVQEGNISFPKTGYGRWKVWLASRLRGPLLAAQDVTNWYSLYSLALVPSGTLAFMVYAKIQTNDLLASFHAQQWDWGRSFQYPWVLAFNSFTHPEAADPLNWNFWLLNSIMILAFLGFTIWAFRKLPAIYSLYTLGMVLFPLSSNRINSIDRYYLVVFPVFILLALWSSHNENSTRNAFVLGLFASIQAVLMIFFALGVPAIA